MPDENSTQPAEPAVGVFNEDVYVAGGGTVMGGTIDVPNVGPKPAVIFKFTTPDGSGFFPPVVLVIEPASGRDFVTLVAEAVDAALAAVGHTEVERTGDADN